MAKTTDPRGTGSMLKMRPDLVPPPMPMLISNADLPLEEREEAWVLGGNLGNLAGYAGHFGHSVALFEVSRRQQPEIDFDSLWYAFQWVAGRHGVIALYNYRMALDAIGRNFRICRTWSDLVDHSLLEAAKETFKRSFPHTREMRQGILHGGEIFSNPERVNRNSISKPYRDELVSIGEGAEQIVIPESFYNNKYRVSFNGSLYGYELSVESAKLLIDITNQVFGAVRKIILERAP